MILLGLGSNLSSSYGDRFKNIELAISYLKDHKIEILKKSSYFESFSYPDKTKPKFINKVILINSSISPETLASIIISIEEKLERKREKKNDPRTCDIDIIDFKNQVIDFKYKNLLFSVPHKKIKLRNFVLFPLLEVCPNWKHPATKECINDIIKNLPTEDKNSILKVDKY